MLTGFRRGQCYNSGAYKALPNLFDTVKTFDQLIITEKKIGAVRQLPSKLMLRTRIQCKITDMDCAAGFYPKTIF